MAIRKIYKDTEWDDIVDNLVVTDIPDEFIKHARVSTDSGVYNVEASLFLAAVAYIDGDIDTNSHEVIELATMIQSSGSTNVDLAMDMDKFKETVLCKYNDLMGSLDF